MLSFGAGVDNTDYAAAGVREPPEPGLRTVFVHEKIDEALRIALAKKGLITIRKFAMLGQTEDKFEQRMSSILGPDLGGDQPTKDLNLTMLAVVWKSCQVSTEFEFTQRARLQEDPNKIPELASSDAGDMRERFWRAHPDVILTSSNEPHKKLIEIVNRDLAVLGVMKFYELGAIRVKKDEVKSTPGLAKSVTDVLKMAEETDLAEVNTDEEVINRIHCFTILCAYLGVNDYRLPGYKEGDEDGSGLSYYSKMIEHRRDFAQDYGSSPMLFTIIADKKIRSKVADLMREKRAKYPKFQDAMKFVLTEKRHLWSDAREEAREKAKKGLASPSTPTAAEKRKRHGSPDSAEKSALDKLKTIAEKNKKKKARQRANKEAREAAQEQHRDNRPPIPRPSSKYNKGAGKGKGGNKTVPDEAFNKIKDLCTRSGVCTFYNLGKCRFGDKCTTAHKCGQCGGSHAYIDRHHQ